jgi:hypothetical protein
MLESVMIIQSSALEARSQISLLLSDLRFRKDADETVALDVIEAICSRIPNPRDYHVAAVGFFVRANIRLYASRRLRFPTLADRLTRAFLQAPLGHERLIGTFVVAPEGA